MVKIAALRSKIASEAAIRRHVATRKGNYFQEPGGSSVVIVDHQRFSGRTWFSYSQSEGTGSSSGSNRSGIRGVGAFMIFDAGPKKGWHVADSVWGDYLALVGYRADAIRARIKELVKRRGLQRLSWIQIGDSIGVMLSSVSPSGNLQEVIARGARGPGGRTYANGSARVLDQGAKFAILLTNVSPLAIKNGGQDDLNYAINQRTKGTMIALEKGVGQDLKLRSARWRGIFVKQA